ncbi:MAG TPA: tetratricopeptide repeat protein [Salinisphaeraceae bacterium]|nr:tetratricopeptide repeat protein [Salinisphaeraceae bacterium]
MADLYDDDDDAARLLRWFSENGLALVLGVVLGAAVIGGWQWWKHHVDHRAQAAAELYGEIGAQLATGNIDANGRRIVQQLKDEYKNSPYTANAAMQLAANALTRQEYDEALRQLNWVIEETDSTPTRNIARIRKARVLWADEQPDAALKLLAQDHPDSFTRMFAELEGDIHASMGDQQKAYSAYQRAAAAAAQSAGAVLQLKLSQTATAANE